ncbi:CPBP family intramembrane glutamic endopeptidase [Aquimarina sp. 2304DJ70-9]|uniref:CPBP family intramembrane glutamic endopeptidase n=1 Tax=Aquimarina penaris TaxID=3231044 RepID=UPI003463507A
MIKSLLKSILTLVIYFALHYGFQKLLKFIFLREEFININPDYFLFIDSILNMLFISILIWFIRKTFFVDNNKIDINIRILPMVVFCAIIFFIIKEPFLRIDLILDKKEIPESIGMSSRSFLSLVATFLNIVILTPVFEELLFRKIMLGFFSRSHLIIAIILSSFFFASIHVNFNEINSVILITFLGFGFVSCLLYIRFGFIYSLLFHVFSNMIWFIVDANRDVYWELLKILDFGFFYWMIIIICFSTIFYLMLRLFNQIIKINNSKSGYLNQLGNVKPSIYSIFVK